MNFHLEGQIVEIVIPFKDLDGNAIVPTDITAALYNGEDRLLMSFGSIYFDPAEVEAKIVLFSSLNLLEGDELQEVRRLEVQMTHADGIARRSHSYVIEAEQSLQIMRNSFMTYDTALMMSSGFVNLTAFVGDTDERRKAGLVEAYRRITSLAMIYNVLDQMGKSEGEHRIAAGTWHYLTAEDFQKMPSHFKRSLRSAQLAEADEILQGNVVARKHAQGIASETIGESSVTLRAGFAGSGGNSLSSAALAHLSGYLDSTVHIGRA